MLFGGAEDRSLAPPPSSGIIYRQHQSLTRCCDQTGASLCIYSTWVRYYACVHSLYPGSTRQQIFKMSSWPYLPRDDRGMPWFAFNKSEYRIENTLAEKSAACKAGRGI